VLGSGGGGLILCGRGVVARCSYEVADPTYVNFHSRSEKDCQSVVVAVFVHVCAHPSGEALSTRR